MSWGQSPHQSALAWPQRRPSAPPDLHHLSPSTRGFSAAVEPSISTGNIVLVCGKNNTLCLFASAARPLSASPGLGVAAPVVSPRPPHSSSCKCPRRSGTCDGLRAHSVEDVLPLPLAPRPYFCLTPRGCDAGSQVLGPEGCFLPQM